LVDEIFRSFMMFHPPLACYLSQIKPFVMSISDINCVDMLKTAEDGSSTLHMISQSDPNHLLVSFYYPRMFNQVLCCVIITSASFAASSTNSCGDSITQLVNHHLAYFKQHLPLLLLRSSILCNYFEEFLANLESLLYLPSSPSSVSFLGGIKIRILSQNLLQSWKFGAVQLSDFVRSFVNIISSQPIVSDAEVVKEIGECDEDDDKLKKIPNTKYSSSLRTRLKSLSLAMSPQQISSKTD
jgi:hypothetical protein